MPPDANTLTQQSALDQFSGASISLAGSLTSQRTPGATVIGLLGSETERNALVHRFGLVQVFHAASQAEARQALTDESNFDEDRKSGILTITVTDRDKVLARDLASGYVEELDRLLHTVNTSSAHKERLFLESRLSAIGTQLAESSRALSTFATRHETINPAGQGAALIQSQTGLQAQLANAQVELASLRSTYSDQNVRVKQIQARINSLQSELRRMNAAPSVAIAQNGGIPSLRELPALSVTYTELSRQVATQQAIFETMTKQLELAKVQEAKEIPAAKELDHPEIAEQRASPHRSLVVLGFSLFGLFVSSALILVHASWRLFNRQTGISTYLSSLITSEKASRTALQHVA